MAALNVAASAPPVFLSKNYINRDAEENGGVSQSSDSLVNSLLERIWDMDPYSYVETSGSSDGASVTYDFNLYEIGVLTTRSIDFIALTNFNLKNFKIEYSTNDGGTWTIFTGADYQSGTANFSGEDFILSLASPVTGINRLKITATHTQSGTGAEKKIGDFIAALADYQMTAVPAKARSSFIENVRDVELGNKNINRVLKKWSAVSYEYFRKTYLFQYVTTSERDTLRRIKRNGDNFLWYPEPGEKKRDIYYAQFEGAWSDDDYSLDYKGAGYDLGFTVRQVNY